MIFSGWANRHGRQLECGGHFYDMNVARSPSDCLAKILAWSRTTGRTRYRYAFSTTPHDRQLVGYTVLPTDANSKGNAPHGEEVGHAITL
jgi:hypothetical protein